jgi:hypothetical protein
MKLHHILLALAALLSINSCDSPAEPADNIYDTSGSLTPYTIGDKYAFQMFVNDFLGDTIHYEVVKDTLIDGETWQIHDRRSTFLFTEENSPDPITRRELVRIDANGLSKRLMMYGLMPIDGSRSFDASATDSIGMYVSDTTNVRVTAGTFTNASNFRSRYQYGDRSIYAPGIGMIYRETSNSYMTLLYAVIGGKRYGS